MRVLHYTLGFPPYRSGGLTKYVVDLMETEQTLGLEVFALYPGSESLFHQKCFIRNDGYYKTIPKYEMRNPIPVSLLYGIKYPADFYDETRINLQSFKLLIENLQPNVFHVHTLMGLPKSFLKYVHEKNIKIVYTTHDYNGLCPKVNFINNHNLLCTGMDEQKCSLCNRNSHGTFYLKLRNWQSLIKFLKSLNSLFR